jgi:hypothetical protein
MPNDVRDRPRLPVPCWQVILSLSIIILSTPLALLYNTLAPPWSSFPVNRSSLPSCGTLCFLFKDTAVTVRGRVNCST